MARARPVPPLFAGQLRERRRRQRRPVLERCGVEDRVRLFQRGDRRFAAPHRLLDASQRVLLVGQRPAVATDREAGIHVFRADPGVHRSVPLRPRRIGRCVQNREHDEHLAVLAVHRFPAHVVRQRVRLRQLLGRPELVAREPGDGGAVEVRRHAPRDRRGQHPGVLERPLGLAGAPAHEGIPAERADRGVVLARDVRRPCECACGPPCRRDRIAVGRLEPDLRQRVDRSRQRGHVDRVRRLRRRVVDGPAQIRDVRGVVAFPGMQPRAKRVRGGCDAGIGVSDRELRFGRAGVALATEPAHAQIVIRHGVHPVRRGVHERARVGIAGFGLGEAARRGVRSSHVDRQLELARRRSDEVLDRGEIADRFHRVAAEDRFGFEDDGWFGELRRPVFASVQELQCGVVQRSTQSDASVAERVSSRHDSRGVRHSDAPASRAASAVLSGCSARARRRSTAPRPHRCPKR